MEKLYVLECDVRRTAEKRICQQCGKEFLFAIHHLTKKNKSKKGLYCSQQCAADARKNRVKLICYNCRQKFERSKSKLKNAKHQFYFCSRKCKEDSQSVDGNCPAIKPKHYKDGLSFYRSRALKQNNSCVDCGEIKLYLLTVHHIDANRLNPKLSNLEVVCANCHKKRHLKLTTKGWKFSTRSLTPREILKYL